MRHLTPAERRVLEREQTNIKNLRPDRDRMTITVTPNNRDFWLTVLKLALYGDDVAQAEWRKSDNPRPGL